MRPLLASRMTLRIVRDCQAHVTSACPKINQADLKGTDSDAGNIGLCQKIMIFIILLRTSYPYTGDNFLSTIPLLSWKRGLRKNSR